MPTKPFALQNAVYMEPDATEVESILEQCLSRTEVDDIDADKHNRTAFMAAARGNGIGGEPYGTMLRLIWRKYKILKCNLKDVLMQRDDRHGWNVLMHAARCGCEENLKIVLEFYDHVFGENLSEVQDQLDWALVDSEIKDLVYERIFGDEANAFVSNYNWGRRPSRRRRQPRRFNSPESLPRSSQRRRSEAKRNSRLAETQNIETPAHKPSAKMRKCSTAVPAVSNAAAVNSSTTRITSLEALPRSSQRQRSEAKRKSSLLDAINIESPAQNPSAEKWKCSAIVLATANAAAVNSSNTEFRSGEFPVRKAREISAASSIQVSTEMEAPENVPPVAAFPRGSGSFPSETSTYDNEDSRPNTSWIDILSTQEETIGIGLHRDENVLRRLERLERTVFERGVSAAPIQKRIKELAKVFGLMLPKNLARN